MKKIFALVLAVAMLCAMSISVSAATVNNVDGDLNKDLSVKYAAGSGTVDAYAATITWGTMEFTYTAASQEWDPETMTWKETAKASWTTDGVIIENRSSKAIEASFAFTASDPSKGVTDITVTADKATTTKNGDAFVLGAATAGVGGKNGTAYSETFTITPVGDLTDTTATETAVVAGYVTITLK